jgi:hypothetical protein
MSIASIPFEIIRRGDGRVALSVNAGRIPYEPRTLQEHPQGLMVQGASREERTLLACRETDVLSAFRKDKLMRLYEFSPVGLFASHALPRVA